MNEVRDFFEKLFEVESWPPRWFCGEWSEFHGWLYIISDLFIWLSYFFIPFFLLAFIFKKDKVPLHRVFWLFGVFILLCGLTHLMDAVIFWWPAYRLSALIRFFTALASVGTVIALFRILPHALALRTSEEYEEELSRRRHIEERLLEAQAELKKKNLILSTRNRELQQFASIVSHDLKAPLQSFATTTDLLHRKYRDDLDSEGKELFQFLNESTERMQSVIVDLLDHSRLGSKKTVAKVNLNKTLDHIVADLKGAIEETKASIEYGELPTITGYPTELRMLFQNLIGNALKFIPIDSSPLIQIRWRVEKNDICHFEIEDNGIGIKKEDQQKIFLIFRRLNKKTAFEGSGIGLANAKRIVELHGGEIWVESTPGQGSTFHFTLPMDKVKAPAE